MRQIVTTAVVLKRFNFGEADRIITVITPDQGKLRLMAKGVRKIKSKLAGGIELFSISSITFIPGKKDISTLVSTRLTTHYGNIVANIERTTTGYDFLKIVDKVTEDECDKEFFDLLVVALEALNDASISIELIESWFYLSLLKLLGHEPNFHTDHNGDKLVDQQGYIFDFDNMAFMASDGGIYSANHIKLLRLLSTYKPEKIMKVSNVQSVSKDIDLLTKSMIRRSTEVST